jgi:pyruvate kinase
MLLLWGVEPFLMEIKPDPEETICDAFDYLRRREWVKPGDWMVVLTNVLAGEKMVDSIQMRPIE